ncbi:hypothetical protein L0663_03380 [Dyadobacter sp. CY107]|uniref:hypothetical protein n=1 Tax=Dyadobacter fanqingshengii TaxID=2906443 RepID=UPI001F449BD2|nr:hypothetical protein [Dyadobacter fanqingshengii]MCF2502405.1 hypothetical protein [Dyadobacter fanqingshengii]
MKKYKFIILTATLFAGFCVPAHAQVEMIERLPEEAYLTNWEPVFSDRIVSYVQLPGDSLEYRKVRQYVKYRPKKNTAHAEKLKNYQDLSRVRYLGSVLIRTGRKFSRILDDSVLGIENTNLSTKDQLTNNEMIATQQ